MRAAISFTIVLVGCAKASPPGSGDDAEPGPRIDVLLVVDSSPTMAEEQAALVASIPGFVTRLDQRGLDYRIGVTSTARDFTYDVVTPFGTSHVSQTGDDGALLDPAACAVLARWIAAGDASPAVMLACLASVGTMGPTYPMPLGAIRDAFDKRVADGTNAAFHRADAQLAIVIVTDHDDCSYEQAFTLPPGQNVCAIGTEPVATYVDFLDGVAGGRDRWTLTAIAGGGPGACTSSLGNADEAVRLEALVAQAGTNAALASICSGDLAAGLDDAIARLGD